MDLPDQVAVGRSIVGVVGIGDDEVHTSSGGGPEIANLERAVSLDAAWSREGRAGGQNKGGDSELHDVDQKWNELNVVD